MFFYKFLNKNRNSLKITPAYIPFSYFSTTNVGSDLYKFIDVVPRRSILVAIWNPPSTIFKRILFVVTGYGKYTFDPNISGIAIMLP